MGLKDLFTVPTGQKVTEKHLRRVLISSICSILLCMTCLVSTTWAWFVVSIENAENLIQIETPEVTVTADGAPVTAVKNLPAGEHEIGISRTVNQDALNKKMECFVILTIQSSGETPAIYKLAVSEASLVTIKTDGACQLSWEAAWFAPAGADEICDGVITVTAKDDAESSTEPTTQASTEAATESSAQTATEPSAEQTTVPTTETNPTESEASSGEHK